MPDVSIWVEEVRRMRTSELIRLQHDAVFADAIVRRWFDDRVSDVSWEERERHVAALREYAACEIDDRIPRPGTGASDAE